MARRVTTVPLDGGQDTTIDKRLAGLARLRSVVNGRLDADGRIISRPRYQAIASTTYGAGTFRAYDLFELNGRLCALGDRLGAGRPTDVFEYVPTGGAAVWKPTDSTATKARLPRGTGMRELPGPPDQAGGISSMDVAAGSGFCLLAYNATNGDGYAQLTRAPERQSVLFARFDGSADGPYQLLQAVALSTGRFWAVGLNSDGDQVAGDYLDVASDEAWNAGPTTIQTSAGYDVLAVAKVTGADQFVVATVSTAGVLTISLQDADGAAVAPSSPYGTVTSLTGNYIAVEADTTDDTITVAVVDGTTLKLYTWALTAGGAASAAATPSDVSSETCEHVTLSRSATAVLQVTATVTTVGTPDVPRIYRWSYGTGTGTFSVVVEVIGCKLASGALYVASAGEQSNVFGVVTEDSDTSPNLLVDHGPSDSVTPLAAKDLGIAAAPLAFPPKIGVDSSQSPTRYYWGHAVQATDGASMPVVCELQLESAERRQIARVGLGAVIAGAMPCWYDGSQLVEVGMTQRPRVVSLTGTTGGGMLGGATYSYRAMARWVDSQRRLHRSPISLPVDVTLSSAQNAVTAVIDGIHTLRHHVATAALGSVLAIELYRTRGIEEQTIPTITGAENADPPSSSLDGLTLLIYAFEVGESGTLHTVTFDSGSTSIAAIVIDVNAVTSADVTASDSGGRLKLTLNSGGADSYLAIVGGTAAEILGLDVQTVAGTSTFKRGTVFHRTATSYLGIGDSSGDRVTITDTRDDDADSDGLPSQAVLYSQVDGPIHDHAPLPSDYVWSGNERVEMAGLPRRQAWQASKTTDQFRGLAFAEEGRPGFTGELVEDIEAVVALDVSKLYFTRKRLWQVDGDGPDDNGQGGYFAAREVSADGGLVADGWRSILETAQGVWFQRDADKLYLARLGSPPTWEGYPIRELLQTYPVIVAATLTANDNMAAFALQTSDGTDGRIALLDLRRGVWFVDDVGGVPQALADYDGRLCYVDENQTVYIADAAAGTGTFVPLTVETGMGGSAAVGSEAIEQILFLGEKLGDCSLELQLDRDDGNGFVTVGTFAIDSDGGYDTAGQTVREEFTLGDESVSKFALKLLVTGSSDSAGLALVALEVYSDKEAGPALLGNTYRK